MKTCPTSNMNRSKFWGFEVSHIVTSLFALAGSNVLLNISGFPLVFSWVIGSCTLLILRIISHGQKNGHLELLAKYVVESHIYLGHRVRTAKSEDLR